MLQQALEANNEAAIEFLASKEHNNQTLLHAIATGDLRTLDKLAEYNPEIFKKIIDNKSLLEIALSQDNMELVDYLKGKIVMEDELVNMLFRMKNSGVIDNAMISKMIPLANKDELESLLYCALEDGLDETAQLLIEAGAKIEKCATTAIELDNDAVIAKIATLAPDFCQPHKDAIGNYYLENPDAFPGVFQDEKNDDEAKIDQFADAWESMITDVAATTPDWHFLYQEPSEYHHNAVATLGNLPY